MRIELLICDKQVELDKSVVFAITKQYEDLSNPTTLINDWSKTISIPFSESNNKLFGEIFRSDRKTMYSPEEYATGIFFNPNMKLPFKLINNGSVVMEGYAKMTSIKRTNRGGSYEINLFGKLGDIFTTLSDISVLKPENDDEESMKYYIGDIIDTEMNRNLIYRAWTRVPNLDKPLEQAEVTDIIGFSCSNRGLYEDFDSNSYQYASDKIIEYKDFPMAGGKTLEEVYKEENLSFESVIGDGLNPFAWGEHRSYYQIPYIYMPRMFDILKKKCSELTDYDIILDESWFNRDNPYYRDFVMMLSNPSPRNEQDYHNIYNMYPEVSQYYWTKSTIKAGYNLQYGTEISVVNEEYQGILDIINVTYGFKISKEYYLHLNMPLKFKLNWRNANGREMKYDAIFSLGAYMAIDVVANGKNGNSKVIKTIMVGRDFDTQDTNLVQHIKIDKLDQHDNANERYTTFETNVDCCFNYNDYGEGVELICIAHWTTTGDVLQEKRVKNVYFGDNEGDRLYLQSVVPTNQSVTLDVYTNSRSFSKLLFEYCWKSDENFFNVILKYTKMFNLMWKCDTLKKTLTILPREKYFSNYTIENWDDKVDFGKDFTITPILLDSKKYKFNYEDNGTYLNKLYKDKFGSNFGEISVKTNYAFNNETKNLFKDIPASIVSTETILPWQRIKERNFTYVGPDDIYPNFATKDNDLSNPFGQYFFYCGFDEFDTNLGDVYLTDDTDYQKLNNKYMYISVVEYGVTAIKVTTYPKLDVANEKYMALFNNPMQSFSYVSNYGDKENIYNTIWKKITEKEHLNIDVHKITCYVHLTPQDFVDFEHYKLVVINNQLYMVNKICDYSFDSLKTKCELIKVMDIENYTKSGTLADFNKIHVSGLNNLFLDWEPGVIDLDGSLGGVASNTPLTLVGANEGGVVSPEGSGAEFKLIPVPTDPTSAYKYVYNIRCWKSIYADINDTNFSLVVKNDFSEETINMTRYSMYPYPRISTGLTKDAYTELTTLTGDSGTFWVRWYNIEESDLTSHPNLSFQSNNANFTIGTWEATGEHMEQDESGDEWFYTHEWQVPVTWTRKNHMEESIVINMTDSLGFANQKTIHLNRGVLNPA